MWQSLLYIYQVKQTQGTKPMKFKKTNTTYGTHLQGNVGATYQELVEVFGEPTRFEWSEESDNKVDAQWAIKFEDGTIATIYNYKNGLNYLGAEGKRVSQIMMWNVGGYSERAVTLVNDEVIEWQHRLHETGKSTNNLVTA
jgi:hypothetical protein